MAFGASRGHAWLPPVVAILAFAQPIVAVSRSMNGTGCFITGSSLTTGVSPRSVAIGDFNADGTADLAVANGDSDDVSVFLGDGTGGFQPRVTLSVGHRPQSITTADFNGDGRPDLAVATAGDLGFPNPSNLSILLGIGGGGFAPAQNFGIGDPASHPSSIAAADFNRDGRIDLALGDYGLSRVLVLLGTGQASFALAGIFGPLFQNVFSVAVGDFNGDGNADAAATSDFINAVSVLLGDGTGLLGPPTTFGAGPLAIAVAVGDLNRDGSEDLVVANEGGGVVSVLLGNGAGSFAPAVNYPVGLGSRAVSLSDFDNDGRLDIAVVNELPHNVSVLLGDGGGGFGSAANFSVGVNPTALAAGDFNRDGLPDLAVVNSGSNSVSIMINAAPMVLPVSLAAGTVNANYPPTVFSATGGTPPYTFAVSGILQALTFDAPSATLYGIFAHSGVVSFLMTVTDANGCAGARPYSLTVNPASAPVTLTSSVNPALPGQSIRLMAGLAFSPTGPATPTGTVSFYDGSALIGAAPVVVHFDTVHGVFNGGAMADIASLGVGSHPLTAVYSGDGNFRPTTSAILTEIIALSEVPTLDRAAFGIFALLLAAAALVAIRARG